MSDRKDEPQWEHPRLGTQDVVYGGGADGFALALLFIVVLIAVATR